MLLLETPRLRLRRFRKSDLDDFFFYAKDSAVGPNAGWAPHENKKESKAILEGFIHESNTFALVEKETDTVIGSISYTVDKLRVSAHGYFEIGYALGKPWWGKGYMTEAVGRLVEYLFAEKQAILLSLQRAVHNLRSCRVAEKSGFLYEGTIRQSAYSWDGTVEDRVRYSMNYAELIAFREAQAMMDLGEKDSGR